jgi:anti-sigma regulatory factor (Ser/Thr protein kinase)
VASGVLTLSAKAESVPAARAFVRARCEAWGGDAAACDAAVLLSSELVTNAVLHARTPMSIDVERRGERVRIEVRDFHPALPLPRRYNVDNATGRGLRLLETMASAWGVVKVPDVEQPGKIVWFELPLHTDAGMDDTEMAAAFRDVLDVDWIAQIDPL